MENSLMHVELFLHESHILSYMHIMLFAILVQELQNSINAQSHFKMPILNNVVFPNTNNSS